MLQAVKDAIEHTPEAVERTSPPVPERKRRNESMGSAEVATVVASGNTKSTTLTIKRKKGEGLGITLRDEGVGWIVVVKTAPCSVAAVAGVIRGDTIVAVDGRSVVGVDHAGLVDILKRTGNTFTMVVRNNLDDAARGLRANTVQEIA